jgi:high-affinity iron transporter
MLVPFLIMLREGIEASLIVGIVASYLRQTGRSAWLRSIWLGVGAAAALCLLIGVALDRAEAEFPQKQQELFEAVVGLIAVTVLSSMVLWMQQAARSMKAALQRSIDQAIGPDGTESSGQGLALVLMVFFAVGREGLESVFFLLATFEQDVGISAPIGALLGLLAAIGIGYSIYAGGVRLNLRRFFRWTGVFIVFVAAGLLAGSVRAFHEAGLWNGLQSTAFDMSGILPSDGPLGTVLAGVLGYQDMPTMGEVIAYVAYLVPALVLLLRPVLIQPATVGLSVIAGLYAAQPSPAAAAEPVTSRSRARDASPPR